MIHCTTLGNRCTLFSFFSLSAKWRVSHAIRTRTQLPRIQRQPTPAIAIHPLNLFVCEVPLSDASDLSENIDRSLKSSLFFDKRQESQAVPPASGLSSTSYSSPANMAKSWGCIRALRTLAEIQAPRSVLWQSQLLPNNSIVTDNGGIYALVLDTTPYLARLLWLEKRELTSSDGRTLTTFRPVGFLSK
jgi:hypothetical protein